MNFTGLKNLQLAASDIAQTRLFYREFLGIREVNFIDDSGIAVFEVGDFMLRFRERADVDGSEPPVDFLGLELESFEAVDAAREEIAERYSDDEIRDVRERYADSRGPYGFYVPDPDGYPLKVYRYNDV